MDKRIYVMLVLFAIAVLLLVPCVLSQEYDKEVGGRMKVLESNLTDTFDPYTTRKLQGHRLAELLYCGLFQEEAQGSYYNVLADTSWFDSTGTYIAFYVRLKKGLRWIEYDSDVEDIVDTAQVTANDVKFTYDMILNDNIEFSNERYSQNLKDIVSTVEVIDDLTVRFRLFTGSEDIRFHLQKKILPKYRLPNGSLTRNDLFTHETMVGSGRYYIVDFNDPGHINFRTNQSYFDIVDTLYIDRISVVTQYNDNLRQRETANSTDPMISMDIRPGDIATLENKYIIKNYQKISYYFLAYNLRLANNKFADVRIRKALSYAINRREIIHEYLSEEYARPCRGSFPNNSGYNNIGLRGYTYSLDTANALMQGAGLEKVDGYYQKDGKPFRVSITFEGAVLSVANKVVEHIKGNWRELGIMAEIKRIPPGELDRVVFERGDFEVLFENIFFPSGTPGAMEDLFRSNSRLNISGYTNPKIDSLFTLRRTLNYDERANIYAQLDSVIANDFPFTFLFDSPALVAVSKKIKNVDRLEPQSFFNYIDRDEWYIRQE